MRRALALLALGLVGASVPGAEKWVLAHYMTDMVPRSDRKLNRWIDPELADPAGSTRAVGGLQQTEPVATTRMTGVGLTEAVDFEIRAARQMGVDGFQFYYPLMENARTLERVYNPIVEEFIRLSETRYPGFKVSLCLSHPSHAKLSGRAERIAYWSAPVRALLKKTGSSPAWVRSDSGAYLFFLWVGDALAGSDKGWPTTGEAIRDVGRAYEEFATEVGQRIDFVYQVRRVAMDTAFVDAVVETFPAVWGWTSSEENEAFWDLLAKRCKETGTRYTQTVYPDYYTSKVYDAHQKGRILSVAESLDRPRADQARHYRVTHLAGTQMKLLQRAVDLDVSLINYVTWNDYPEGHHMAPEKHHNFGPSLLLRHYKARWRTGREVISNETAVVFYKSYKHDVVPTHTLPLHVLSKNKNLGSEDRIELVTLLKKPAQVMINDTAVGRVGAGLQVSSIPSAVGPVRVRLERDGVAFISYVAPIEITGNPIRDNRLTVSFSNRYDAEMEALFPSEGR